MSGEPYPVDDLVIQLGELTISWRRGRASSAGSETQLRSPLAGPRAAASQAATAGRRGQDSSPTSTAWEVVGVGSAWSESWTEALIRAESAAAIADLDLSPVSALIGRLRGSDQEWTPLARLGRALRAGLGAQAALAGRLNPVASPRIPYPNKIFVVLRGAPGQPAGFTEDSSIYFRVVGGAGRTFHPNSVSHSFATRAEAEAYIIGSGEPWPPRLEASGAQ